MGDQRQRQVRLSANEIIALVRAYGDQRASIKDLSNRYGINRSTVLDHLDRHGVVRRGSCPILSPKQIAEAAKLRSSGWSFARIGRQLGVTDVTVANSLRRQAY